MRWEAVTQPFVRAWHWLHGPPRTVTRVDTYIKIGEVREKINSSYQRFDEQMRRAEEVLRNE